MPLKSIYILSLGIISTVNVFLFHCPTHEIMFNQLKDDLMITLLPVVLWDCLLFISFIRIIISIFIYSNIFKTFYVFILLQKYKWNFNGNINV